MLFKVKRFSTKQKLFETEDGNLIEPINGKYKYFKMSNGTYVEGILSELTKKDLKGLTTEKELDAEIGKQLLDEFFQNYKPTNEVNQPKWKMTISKLLGMFSNDYKDKENLDKLFKKITTIENFSEFLSFSTQDFKDLTIDDLHKNHNISIDGIVKMVREGVRIKTIEDYIKFAGYVVPEGLPQRPKDTGIDVKKFREKARSNEEFIKLLNKEFAQTVEDFLEKVDWH